MDIKNAFLCSVVAAVLIGPPMGAQVLPITTDSEEAREHFLLGREAAFHWDPEQAHVHLNAAIAADPGLVLAYLHLAGTSRPAERQQYFDLAEAYRCHVSPAEQRMIEAFRALLLDAQFERAIEYLEELAEAYPDDRYSPPTSGSDTSITSGATTRPPGNSSECSAGTPTSSSSTTTSA